MKRFWTQKKMVAQATAPIWSSRRGKAICGQLTSFRDPMSPKPYTTLWIGSMVFVGAPVRPRLESRHLVMAPYLSGRG